MIEGVPGNEEKKAEMRALMQETLSLADVIRTAEYKTLKDTQKWGVDKVMRTLFGAATGLRDGFISSAHVPDEDGGGDAEPSFAWRNFIRASQKDAPGSVAWCATALELLRQLRFGHDVIDNELHH